MSPTEQRTQTAILYSLARAPRYSTPFQCILQAAMYTCRCFVHLYDTLHWFMTSSCSTHQCHSLVLEPCIEGPPVLSATRCILIRYLTLSHVSKSMLFRVFHFAFWSSVRQLACRCCSRNVVLHVVNNLPNVICTFLWPFGKRY